MMSCDYDKVRFKSEYINRLDARGLDKEERLYTYEAGNSLGKAFTNITLADGLSISLLNYKSEAGLEIDYEIKNGPVVFNFILSGKSEVMISESGTEPVSICRKPGCAGVKFKTESELRGNLKIPPGVCFSSVGVQIDEHSLREYIQDDADRLPGEFVDILYNRKSQQGDNRFFSGLTPSMMSAAASVSRYAENNSISRLFLQSKATELICLKLFQLMAQKKKSVHQIKLSPQDRENLFHAREMLVQDLRNPPTIAELSRRAGINQFKLKQGFKKEFGTTVYGYFNRNRMEKALELLKSGEKNISETAGQIGYSNVSHFIHSFKKQYGVTPGRALKKYF